MRVHATTILKGSTAIATTDVLGLRIGTNYASSVEVATFSPTTTSIITSLTAMYGVNSPLGQSSGAFCFLGAPTGNCLVFMHFLEDADQEVRLWIRRNSAQLATGVAVLTDCGSVMNWPGRVRASTDLQAYFRAAIVAGVDAGLTAAGEVIK